MKIQAGQADPAAKTAAGSTSKGIHDTILGVCRTESGSETVAIGRSGKSIVAEALTAAIDGD